MGAAPVLTILKDGQTVKSHTLEGEAVLGRSEGCVIRLEDRIVSRQHAVFRQVGDGVQVEKRSEFAPLLVNGAECTRAVLKEGDVIAIGPYLVKLSLSKEAAKAASYSSDQATLPAAEFPTLALGGPDALAPTVPLAMAELQAAAQAPAPAAASGQAQTAVSAQAGLPELDMVAGASSPADAAAGIPGLDPISPISIEPQKDEPFGGAIELGPNGGAPLEIAPAQEVSQATQGSMISEEAQTKIAPAGKVSIHLIFKPGTANFEDFELTKDEISIGRGSNCDIVLNDKKCSRKNSIIKRKGMAFVIRDLQSANGTYVNGVRVEEQELSGDDTVKIGSVEFQFKALSADYLAREKNFMPVQSEEAPAESEDPIPDIAFVMPNTGNAPQGYDNPPMEVAVPPLGDAGAAPDANQQQPIVGAPIGSNGGIPGFGPIPGIAGVAGMGGSSGKQSLLDKYKAMTPRRRAFLLILIGVFLYLYMEEEEVPVQPKKAATAKTAVKGKPSATFESLTPADRKFIETQYQLALDLYTAGDYDKALFEIEKILKILPSHEQARELERYAKEGKRKLEAKAEEKKRKEEEAALRAKIALLVEETKELMKNKQYEQARELFTQIVTLDPDNPAVSMWKKEIEDWEERKRLEEQTKRVQQDINLQGWEVFKEGAAFKKQGKYHSAIEAFQRVLDMGVSDNKLIGYSKSLIRKTRAIIAAKRDPLLEEAKQAEDSGEFAKAFQLYLKATKVDPPHKAGYAGMNRIRGILHDKAKMMYTEAVLAESYSDFSTAKKKFKECMDTAPTDDIYHERAKRRLAHYYHHKDE